MPQLTKAWIDKSAPKAKDYIIWDDIVKGFGCRVYPTKKPLYTVTAHRRTRELLV